MLKVKDLKEQKYKMPRILTNYSKTRFFQKKEITFTKELGAVDKNNATPL